MRKLFSLLALAVCIAISMPAQAQLKWGVKGGLNMTKLSFSDIGYGAFSSDHKQGFFIGPMAEFSTALGLGVDASLLYNQLGSDEYKQAGIDVPVNLKYTFGAGSTLGIYIAVGPDFFFNFKDNATYTEDGSRYSTDHRKAMVGANIGAGVKLLNHLQIGVNYNAQLGRSGDVTWSDATKIGKYKFNTWQISLAYLF
jgi:opacity protein-like surface antigen